MMFAVAEWIKIALKHVQKFKKIFELIKVTYFDLKTEIYPVFYCT